MFTWWMFDVASGRIRSHPSCWTAGCDSHHGLAMLLLPTVFDLGQGQGQDTNVLNLFIDVVRYKLLSPVSGLQGCVGPNWPQSSTALQRRRASPYQQNHRRIGSHSTLTQAQWMHEHLYNETILLLDQMHRSGWSHLLTTGLDPAHIHPKLM